MNSKREKTLTQWAQEDLDEYQKNVAEKSVHSLL